jgi:hypothetical protein
MAYLDFPDHLQGQKQRKAFWLSDEGLQLIAGWRRNGVPLTTIAEEHIGVCRTTFWNWYRESEEMRKACSVAKDVCDMTVEDALYRRAVGYDYWEEVWDLIEGELRLSRKLKKHMPPDTKAIMQWLYNRLPLVWRALQEPLQDTQYTETIKNILVAMKEVAENGESQQVEVKEESEG